MPKTNPSPEPLFDEPTASPKYEAVYGAGNPWVEWLRGVMPKLLKRPARKVLPKQYRRGPGGRFASKPPECFGRPRCPVFGPGGPLMLPYHHPECPVSIAHDAEHPTVDIPPHRRRP